MIQEERELPGLMFTQVRLPRPETMSSVSNLMPYQGSQDLIIRF